MSRAKIISLYQNILKALCKQIPRKQRLLNIGKRFFQNDAKYYMHGKSKSSNTAEKITIFVVTNLHLLIQTDLAQLRYKKTKALVRL